MNRDSKKFTPGKWSRIMVPFLLFLLTVVLGALMFGIALSLIRIFP